MAVLHTRDQNAVETASRGTNSSNSIGFTVALLCVLVDVIGIQFTAPSLVPYCISMGINIDQVGPLYTARYGGQIVSNLVMPPLADKYGRKVVVLWSLGGSMVAYVIQGIAFRFEGSEFALMFAGKLIAGLFGGTFPIILTYITDISMPDLKLLKTRITQAVATLMAAPVALQPLGGAIATFGLYLPLLVSAGIALVGLILTQCFMNEVFKPGSTEEDDPLKKTDEKEDASKEPRPSVWRDPPLLTLGAAFFFVAFFIVGQQIQPPLLLERSSFGLEEDSETKTQERIALTAGLVAIPTSLVTAFVMTVGYLSLSKRGVRDSTCVLVGGLVAAATFFIVPMTSTVWQLCIVNAVQGAGCGMFMGAVQAMPSKYLAICWPKDIASGRGVYNLLMTVGTMVAGIPLTVLFDAYGIGASYYCTGFAMLLSTVFGVIFSRQIHAKLDPSTPDTPSSRHALEKGAVDVEEFKEMLSQRLIDTLEKRNYHLWNGRAQQCIVDILDSAYPVLRPWDDADSGRAHLEDVANLYHSLGKMDELHRMEHEYGLEGALSYGSKKSPGSTDLGGAVNGALAVQADQTAVDNAL